MPRHALLIATLIGCVDPSQNTGRPPVTDPIAATAPVPQTWRAVDTQPPPPFVGGIMQQMTDGTILVQDQSSALWWRLHPDATGSYSAGTWTQTAPALTTSIKWTDNQTGQPAQATAPYRPLYFGSATLTDGRMIVEGGEYVYNVNQTQGIWTINGAVYDPVADKWAEVKAPATSWSSIGDAIGIVLDDGTYIQTDCCSQHSMAAFNPSAGNWNFPIGDGKADIFDEESWAKLWDGRIVTVDANDTADADRSEIYDPATKLWTGHGKVPVHIADYPGSHEVGPEGLLPDGTVVAIGGTAHNALYNPTTDTWSALPDTDSTATDGTFYGTPDGPGAVLPNGDFMFAANRVDPNDPNTYPFGSPTHYFTLHAGSITKLDPTSSNEPAADAVNSAYQHFFLILPTGELMMTDQGGTMDIFTPTPGTTPNAIPRIIAAPQLIGDGPEAPTGATITMYRGRSYTLPVYRMNGINEGAYYGDDAQMSTAFPLVRTTNMASGNVAYYRTYDHSNRSISPDSSGITKLDVPAGAELGETQLVVVANGVASDPITVNVK